jgi:excisionase family DNA binding protein
MTSDITAPTASPTMASFLDVHEAAARLGLSKAALYSLLNHNLITHYRLGRVIRIAEEDLLAYLQAQRVERQAQSPRYGRYPAI